MKLRKLSDLGLERMGNFLDSFTAEVPENYPEAILTDQTTSETLPADVEIDQDRRFTHRFDAAAYLYERFTQLRTPAYQLIERDKGVWAWLALLWFNQLCLPDRNGVLRPKERARWIPVLDDARRYYRHLLLGPYLIYRMHARTPDLTEAVLSSELHVGTSEVFRTIIETQQFVTSPSVVSLIGRLYFDSKRKRLIRGAGTKGPGGVRRLGNVLNQLDRTFDLHSIRVDELMSLLPQEFLEVRQRTEAA